MTATFSGGHGRDHYRDDHYDGRRVRYKAGAVGDDRNSHAGADIPLTPPLQ